MTDILSQHLASNTLKCLDVGARGGLQSNWLPFKNLFETDAFEPDAAACEIERAAGRPGEHWYPIGLGAKTGKAKLYVLEKASSSSLYPPNPDVMKRYAARNYGKLDKVIEIEVMSLSDFIDQYNRPLPNLIKLDVQGAELDILKSIRPEHWRDVLAIQVEVEFLDYYVGQPLFHDIDGFMRSRGFELFDLLSNKVYRVKNDVENYYLKKYLNIAKTRRDISCRMVAGDAIYVRPAAQILAAGDRTQCIKYFLVLLAYRCLDEALWYTERLLEKGIVDAADAGALVDTVRKCAPKPSLQQRADKLGKWARKVMKWLGIGRSRKIDYWLDRSWDY